MQDVFGTLEQRGIRYFVTGSVAASVHGVLRQTHDGSRQTRPDP